MNAPVPESEKPAVSAGKLNFVL
ncbi:MAG: hypothetical protein JWO60_1596, partial [Frankiales bacterium]|nr:hypothetical protein [Frankiales bacterium]